MTRDEWVAEAALKFALHVHKLARNESSPAEREATWQEVLAHLRTDQPPASVPSLTDQEIAQRVLSEIETTLGQMV